MLFRFIAGNTLNNALDISKKLFNKNRIPIINYIIIMNIIN
jgi:hypothetical protein